jgi:hypothetical protein
MSSSAHEILCHDLARGHLSCLGRLFNIVDEFLLLHLELCALTVELALCLFEGALMLT